MHARRTRALSITIAALLAGCAPTPEAALPPPRPSAPTPVVLISLDTLRADRLNSYGYRRFPLSPRIDALAADGILFERQIAAAPWTIPSHMSLLTSLWPSSHGVTGSLQELQEDDADYPTLADARTTLAESLGAAGYPTAAFTAGETMAPHFGFAQGFAVYRTNMMKVSDESMAEMKAWLTDQKARPFFLFWHTFEVHAPYLGTAFLDKVLPPERLGDVRDMVSSFAERIRKRTIHAARFEPMLRKRRAFNPHVAEALYLGAILDADRRVGELVDLLKATGRYDETLFILTSDHGEEFRDHGPRAFYNAHGHSLWRELTQVPLIVKLPRQTHAGTRVAALSRSVDVMPTVLDLLRLPAPPEMQGQSLRPLWETASSAPRLAFLEALEEPFEEKAVETDRYKYVVRIDAASVKERGRAVLPAVPVSRALFDLAADPRERQDLLAGTPRPEHVRLAEELDTVLRQHLSAQRADSRPARLSPELLEGLRSLGYVH